MTPNDLARCSDCDSPLEVQVTGPKAATGRPELKPDADDPARHDHIQGESDGKVYCSNPECFYWTTAHPAGKEANRGVEA